jgi:hypothetical protein
MAEVTAALSAGDFDSTHSVGVVFVLFDFGFIDSFVEARPSASGVEFGVAIEEFFVTAGAPVDSLFVVIPIFACEGSFRAFFSKDGELHGGEDPSPFVFVLRELFVFHLSTILRHNLDDRPKSHRDGLIRHDF